MAGSQYDDWRIQPGELYDNFNEDNWRDVVKRVEHMERIMAQQIHQWNAPTLIRGLSVINGNTYTDNLYRINGDFTLTSADYNAAQQRFEKVITMPDSFDNIDAVVHITADSNTITVNLTGEEYVFVLTPNTFRVYVHTASPPGAGIIRYMYSACGYKIE